MSRWLEGLPWCGRGGSLSSFWPQERKRNVTSSRLQALQLTSQTFSPKTWIKTIWGSLLGVTYGHCSLWKEACAGRFEHSWLQTARHLFSGPQVWCEENPRFPYCHTDWVRCKENRPLKSWLWVKPLGSLAFGMVELLKVVFWTGLSCVFILHVA